MEASKTCHIADTLEMLEVGGMILESVDKAGPAGLLNSDSSSCDGSSSSNSSEVAAVPALMLVGRGLIMVCQVLGRAFKHVLELREAVC